MATVGHDSTAHEPAAMSPGRGALMVAAIVVVVAVLIALATGLQLQHHMAAGFLFALYWGGIKGTAWPEFLPAVVGSLGGLLLGYLMHMYLPAAFGTPGLLVGLAIILLAIYLLVMHTVPLVVNNAFMLFLTIGTTKLFTEPADYTWSAAAILLTAAYMGGLLFVVGKLTQRRAG